MAFSNTHRSVFSQPSLEKLLPAVNRNKHRGPPLGKMQIVRDLGTLSPKWVIFIKTLPTGSGTLLKMRQKDGKGQ